MEKDQTYRFINALIILLIVVFVILSCETTTEGISSGMEPDPNQEEDLGLLGLEEPAPPISFQFRMDSLKNKTAVDSFLNDYSAQNQEIIFALNRMDAGRLTPGDQLIVPDTLTGRLMDYAPFPERLHILDSIPKTVLISQRIQAIALYEDGQLVRWGPVSSGKKSTPTPNGLFYGNYRARKKISTVNPDWLMPFYFNFMNKEGVGVHQYAMPGFPASHACVRLRKEDAAFIYDWAEQWKLDSKGQAVLQNGTPFMVFGNYDFDTAPPWEKLAADPTDNFLSSDEMDTLKRYTQLYWNDSRNFPEAEEEELPSPSKTKLEIL